MSFLVTEEQSNRKVSGNDAGATGEQPPPQRRSASRRIALGLIFGLPLAWFGYNWATFPSDKTPVGAYLRIVRAVNQGTPKEFFAYTEEKAQHACYTILDYRKRALSRAEKDFPPEELKKLKHEYQAYATAPDGADVFALMVEKNGWLDQLRRDVSGVDHVEIEGERATVETTVGTRYAMRRRPGGIWGLTAFTPALVQEAEKAARDFDQVEKAAQDYARVRAQAP